ncbi:Endonuclease-reverse transcriptase [Popillia japonica]|uniref:Endonuclease-reverse transcriptase n=1 Tax=Popillia japonica TaxID=7064 RepID=A0AAW1JE41_POPJA
MMIKLAHINIRSLIAHFNDLVEHINSFDYDILAVGETWLTSATVRVDGYTFLRCDRSARGGGVGFYIRDNTCCRVLESSNNIEQLWVNIGRGSNNTIFGVIYRPPTMPIRVFIDELESSISNFLPMSNELICTGDFNIDLLKTDSLPTLKFVEALEVLGFHQIITEPTRVAKSSASFIDLILVSNVSSVQAAGVRSVEFSDHDVVYCNTIFQQHLASIHLDDILYVHDINAKVHILSTRLIEIFNLHAPIKTIIPRTSKSPWITDVIKTMILFRDRARTRFLKTRLEGDWNHYKDLRNLTRQAIMREKKAYFRYLDKTHNPNCIWKELKSLNISNKKQIALPPHLRNIEDINNHFVNSVPKSVTNNSLLLDYYQTHTKNNISNDFYFSLIDEEQVSRALDSISSTACGSDDLSLILGNKL